MRMDFRMLCAVALCAAAFSAAAAPDDIIKLLNSRSSGSPSGYEEAAAIVAADAEKGAPLQQFVIALVSKEPGAPAAARMSEERRNRYLDSTRERLRTLAERRNNGLAWYLLSLENGDKTFLKRAATAGNVQALNAWGTAVIMDALHGVSPPPSDTNAVAIALRDGCECFWKAAAKGDANGSYNLGMCYMNGYGCKVDVEMAFNCFRTAAEKGHPEAFVNIGGFYRDGKVVRQNYESAARFFEKSAKMGNVYGMFNYALALQRGEGVEKDVERAFELFTLAAEAGNMESMNALGMCYYTGTGTKKDVNKAVHWYRNSSARGYAPAMENMAVCTEKGEGGTLKSKHDATVWRIRASAARGDVKARAWLERNGYKTL